MLILPSERIVDISTHRVKHHALQRRGPRPDARHSELYPLVDVIYRYRHASGQPRNGHTEYDYYYSGLTLADIHKADGWSKEDKQAFLNWLREDAQKSVIETARRRLTEYQPLLSCKKNSSPSHLYSLLELRVRSIPLQQACAKQWLATVKNMLRKGIKHEELHYSGILEYITHSNDSEILNKQQLLNSINFQNIRLQLSTELVQSSEGLLNFQEVAKFMPHQAIRRAALKLDKDCLCILRYLDIETNYRIGVIKTKRADHPLALNKYWFALDPYGRAINPAHNSAYYTNSDEAITAANNHALSCENTYRKGYRFHTHYDHFTLYGGDNYREWIVSLRNFQRTFFGPHHFDHNVLVHIRTTTRTDINSRKLLFIEEIQSDWHQQGKRYGYDNNPWGSVANAPFKNEWAILAVKLMLIRACNNGYDAIAWTGGRVQELRYGRELPAIAMRYDREIPKALNKLCSPYSAQAETTHIKTCEPWLNIIKENDMWRVEDGEGKFKTKPRYASRAAALEVLYRHSRHIHLEVPVLHITDSLRHQVESKGLPLFGVIPD